jgi:signal transduction histidine kinase
LLPGPRPPPPAPGTGARLREHRAEPRFWAGYLACGLLATAVYELHRNDANQAVVGIGLWTSALVAVVAGLTLYRPRSIGVWLLLAAAAGAAATRWIVRESYLLENGAVGDPGSLMDVFGLVAYGFVSVVLVVLVARREGPNSLFDVGMIAVGLGLVARLFLWDTYFDNSPLSSVGTATQLAYAAGDVLIVASIVRLLVGARTGTPAQWLLVAAALSTLTSDAAYKWSTLVGDYMPGSAADAGWITAPALLGVAALHPSMSTLFDPRPRAEPRLRPSYLAVLVLAAVASPVLLFTNEGTEDVAALAAIAAIAAGASALSLFALARVVGLVHEGVALRRRLVAQNERLLILDDMKDTFLATASHELRTPLSSIYGATLTLRSRQDELGPADADALLALIGEQADRLAKIVDQIVEASELDAGRLLVAFGPCDGVAVADEVLRAAQVHAPAHTLRLAGGAGVPPVYAGPGQLAQVLTKLVDNAVKYSPAGGVVEVRVEATAGGVRFSVSDEGLGIRARDQERIFEKFSRVDPQMARGVGGTGLGLYICREIVRLLGGRIWVRSEEGRGSTFFVDLPAATESVIELPGAA